MDPSNKVIPGSDFTATMSLAGYAKMLPLGKRSAMVSIIAPMGRISGDLSIDGLDFSSTARGFGDPMLQFSINVIGPKAIMNIPDMLRYKPGFSFDIVGTLAVPIGQYDNTSPINIGQNRWYGRIGLPVVWQIGPWVPGKRTTIEFLPAVWLFGDNNDFVGQQMKTAPMYQLEAHLTRDFMERSSRMSHAVLLVDDERFARTVYSDYLRAAGYEVEVADGFEAALAILGQRRFDVILTDVILPGSRDGLELLDLAKQLDPHAGVIVITALDKVGPTVRAMRAGASDYLVKPVTPEGLQLAVQRCLSTRALLAENQALRGHLKLFETGQRLVSTLDRDRLVPMALAAIASECGSPGCALVLW